MAGGVRELREETQFERSEIMDTLRWYPHTVSTTDSIGEGFHYVIAHCFAEVNFDVIKVDSAASLPKVKGTDDALDANWFTLEDIKRMVEDKKTTPGVMRVIQRMDELSTCGLIPTTANLT